MSLNNFLETALNDSSIFSCITHIKEILLQSKNPAYLLMAC